MTSTGRIGVAQFAVGIVLIFLPGVVLCAVQLLDFDARAGWMLLIVGVLAWIAGGWLIGSWPAMPLVFGVSLVTALVIWFGEPLRDSAFIGFFLFLAVPYAVFSAVAVGLGLFARRIGA
jgi:hypothetical protein